MTSAQINRSSRSGGRTGGAPGSSRTETIAGRNQAAVVKANQVPGVGRYGPNGDGAGAAAAVCPQTNKKEAAVQGLPGGLRSNVVETNPATRKNSKWPEKRVGRTDW